MRTVNYAPDAELVLREKPFNRSIGSGVRSTQYSARYGIEVELYDIEWIMDKDGFRNQKTADSADIVVLGDSYVEYGATEAGTFSGRLTEKLPWLSGRNLGKSGYSVGQYVHVLDRFGLQYKPKVAIMAFYEGNDIAEMRDYLAWKSGRWKDLRRHLFKFSTDSLWRRFAAAVSATLVQVRAAAGAIEERLLRKLAMIRGYASTTHPEIAVLNLNGRVYPKLFIDRLPEITVDQMLATEELNAIQSLFYEFRNLRNVNGITPVACIFQPLCRFMLHIPPERAGRRGCIYVTGKSL